MFTEINDGLLYCYDIRTLSKDVYDILEPQGIKAMLHYGIYDGDRMIGSVGIDECRNNRYWNGKQVKLLYDVSKIVERTLVKYRAKNGNKLENLKRKLI